VTRGVFASSYQYFKGVQSLFVLWRNKSQFAYRRKHEVSANDKAISIRWYDRFSTSPLSHHV